jgi:hypothetical protein
MAWQDLTGVIGGGALGYALKEAVELFKARQQHRHDLATRFFDRGLDVAMKALREGRTAAHYIRLQYGAVLQSIEDGGALNVEVLANFAAAAQERLKATAEDASGASFILDLFFDKPEEHKGDSLSEIGMRMLYAAARMPNRPEDFANEDSKNQFKTAVREVLAEADRFEALIEAHAGSVKRSLSKYRF